MHEVGCLGLWMEGEKEGTWRGGLGSLPPLWTVLPPQLPHYALFSLSKTHMPKLQYVSDKERHQQAWELFYGV